MYFLQPQREREVRILFGTQTGTAERFANELKESLVNKYGVECMVTDLEDYAHEEDLGRERCSKFGHKKAFVSTQVHESTKTGSQWLTELWVREPKNGS